MLSSGIRHLAMFFALQPNSQIIQIFGYLDGVPSGIYGSINLKIVFWALLTTLNMPCDGQKAEPKFLFFGPG